MRWVVAVVLAGSCTDSRAPAPPIAPPPAVARDPVPADRRCGEVGPVATPLPDAVRDGLERIGEASLAAGETARLGTVQLRYDASHWNGSMETGSRGPALVTEIPRAEAGERGAWGHSQPLRPDGTSRFYVGAYRFDLRASSEKPPARATVQVDKRACPDYTVVENRREPLAMWIGTEAIRQHTLQDARGMLQVSVEAPAQVPPLIDVKLEGWDHRFEPRPGERHAVRIDDRTVVIDEIARAPRPGGPDRLHARVTVTAAPPRPVEAAGPPGPCAGTTAARSGLPAELARPHRLIADARLGLGTARTIAGTRFELVEDKLPGPVLDHARTHRRPPPERTVSVRGDDVTASFGTAPRTEFARTAHAVFRLDGEPGSRVRIRAYPSACAATLAVPLPDQPITLWLSTVGVQTVTVGDTARTALTLQLFADERSPSLGATSEHAYDNKPVRADLVGHVATFDGLRLEVVEAVVHDAAATGLPEAHVEVRISRD